MVETLLRGMSRALFALLLLVAAATPSMAELACFDEALTSAPAASVASTVAASSPDGQPEERSCPCQDEGQCSFGSCSAWVAVAGPQRANEVQPLDRRTYPSFVAHALSAASRDGPDHPPRA